MVASLPAHITSHSTPSLNLSLPEAGFASLLPASIPSITQLSWPFGHGSSLVPLALLSVFPPRSFLGPVQSVDHAQTGPFQMPLAVLALPHVYNRSPSQQGVIMSSFSFRF